MGKYLLKLPKMGESIAEATLVKWLKEVGDKIETDNATPSASSASPSVTFFEKLISHC